MKYKCSICGYQSDKEESFIDHEIEMWKGNPKRVFRCPVCNFETDKRDEARVHLRKHVTKSKT